MPPAELPSETLRRQLIETRRDVVEWSQQRLADRVSELGGDLTRSAIGKIESGDRAVAVDEAFVLAGALSVAPIHLFVRRDDGQMRLTKQRRRRMTFDAKEMRAWVRGEVRLFDVVSDVGVFNETVPASEAEARMKRRSVTGFDELVRFVNELFEARADEDVDGLSEAIERIEAELERHRGELRRLERLSKRKGA